MLRTDSGEPKYRRGVLGIVTSGGKVWPGDPAKIEMPLKPWSAASNVAVQRYLMPPGAPYPRRAQVS
jgi:hypothetical protein